MSFQFIGFPSEWGAELRIGQNLFIISFPIYWVPQRVGRGRRPSASFWPNAGFQFIGFPSEWGVAEVADLFASAEEQRFPIYWIPQRVGRRRIRPVVAADQVSNLLGSPASGEGALRVLTASSQRCFQFIGFPSEWGARL
mgnify:CR=1 FL=1